MRCRLTRRKVTGNDVGDHHHELGSMSIFFHLPSSQVTILGLVLLLLVGLYSLLLKHKFMCTNMEVRQHLSKCILVTLLNQHLFQSALTHPPFCI